MANHRIPRRAAEVERVHGLDVNGDVITLAVYRHRREGHAADMFYVVQYREYLRRVDRSTRVTQQFSGRDAEARMNAEIAGSRALLAESRVRAARELAA